ncbi:hypothetical protein NFI96_006184 [Prochilodus magdalenae]|nr:hypothetical protein NFI96_006184 [Prochilodus magdalenae]
MKVICVAKLEERPSRYEISEDLSPPRWSGTKKDIPVRDVVIEQNGVKKSVSLLNEAATKQLQKDHVVEITHIRAKKRLCGKDLTSSDCTVVTVSTMNFISPPSIPS